jgi:hypothetical protein
MTETTLKISKDNPLTFGEFMAWWKNEVNQGSIPVFDVYIKSGSTVYPLRSRSKNA